MGKLSSRRDRRRNKGGDEDEADNAGAAGARGDDRRARREQRRNRRNGGAEAKSPSKGEGGSRADRRAERRSRKVGGGEAKSSRVKGAAVAEETPAATASNARAHWNVLRDSARKMQEQRGKLAPVMRGSGSEAKTKGKVLRTLTDSRFDSATASLLQQVRETKAQRAQASAQKKSGLRGIGRTRSTRQAAEIRARADELLMEELGI